VGAKYSTPIWWSVWVHPGGRQILCEDAGAVDVAVVGSGTMSTVLTLKHSDFVSFCGLVEQLASAPAGTEALS
jgi:hypothetical protein